MDAQERLLEADRFVRERYGNRATGLSALAAGEWSQAYALQLDGREMVLRLGAYGEDFLKDRAMARHATRDLPIPSVIEVGPAGDRWFAVSERVHGTALDALDEMGMRAVLPSLLRALDAIRDIDVPATRGYGVFTGDGAAPFATWADALLDVARPNARIPGWREVLDRSREDARTFDLGVERLAAYTRELNPERRVIHSDLLNRNVLVQGDAVTGVFDWGNAMYGDPLYDAAWLLYWWQWVPEWSTIDIRGELQAHWALRGDRHDHQEERLRCCLVHIGLAHIAYSAYTDRWDDLRRNARQVRTYL